jgi:hypothetical protein
MFRAAETVIPQASASCVFVTPSSREASLIAVTTVFTGVRGFIRSPISICVVEIALSIKVIK